MSNNNIKDVILQDSSSSGKFIDWKHKKETTLKIASSFKRLKNINRQVSLEQCGTDLEFLESSSTGKKKLNNANFCKVRLCPMCSWRRSLKVYSQVSQCMDLLDTQNKYNYIFVTLTVKNCKYEELSETLDWLFYSFKKFNLKAKVKNAYSGYFSALEVTYNQETDEWHPHFHVIYLGKPNYYKTRDYINQGQLIDLWRDSLDVDYDPNVDIRKLKTGKDKNKSVAEVAKYTVNEGDLLIEDDFGNLNITATDRLVEMLDIALHSRRLVSFSGDFREAKKQLKLDDAENGNLVVAGDDDIRDDIFDLIVRYKWGYGANGVRNYYFQDIKKKDL